MPTSRTRGAPMPYTALAGVVPATKGWCVVGGKLQGISLAPEAPRRFATFQEVLDWKPDFQIIAVHAPIGLPTKPTHGGRRCDHDARALLRWPRSGAIGSAPARHALTARTYDEATEANEGLSPVVWRRFAHYGEVDEEMSPYWQRTVFEVHPELSFYDLNGDRPLRYAKDSVAGANERRRVLAERMPGIDRVYDERPVGATRAQVLDACAALWSARRIKARAAIRIPEDPEWDDNGMRMEIWR